MNAFEDGEPWQAREHMFDAARVDNLAPPDFREGAELHRTLRLAFQIKTKKVAMRRMSEGELACDALNKRYVLGLGRKSLSQYNETKRISHRDAAIVQRDHIIVL